MCVSQCMKVSMNMREIVGASSGPHVTHKNETCPTHTRVILHTCVHRTVSHGHDCSAHMTAHIHARG